MATKSPVFPMPEPHHFSDYGFESQIDYFQVLEEAKRYKQREMKSTDTFHFKLQKPESSKKKKNKNRRWWKTALFFFKSRWSSTSHINPVPKSRPGSISGPIYITESFSGPSTPFRASSGPLGEIDIPIPYLNLREINMEEHPLRISAPSPMPIYLVT